MFQRILRPAASWWLTTVLSLSLCCSYLFFSFREGAYDKWTAFLFHSLPGVALYTCLMLNIAAASIRITCKRLGRPHISEASIKKMDICLEVPVTGPGNFVPLVEFAKDTGFRTEIKSGTMNAVKGRFSFLPGTFVRLGLIILMVSVMISVYARKTDELILHSGETAASASRNISLISVNSNMPEEFLQIGEDVVFRLSNVSAIVESEGKKYRVTSSLPSRISRHYYRITHIGFSQELAVKTNDIDFMRNQDLDILPPGKNDTVTLPSGNMALIFSLQPGKTVKKGVMTGRFFNLANPGYNVVLKKGTEKITEFTLKPGESVNSGEAAVSLGKNSIFVKMISVYDPAVLWMYAGVLITITGLILMPGRFFWYEKKMRAVISKNTLMIGYSEEFYKKWGIQKFLIWKEKIPFD